MIMLLILFHIYVIC